MNSLKPGQTDLKRETKGELVRPELSHHKAITFLNQMSEKPSSEHSVSGAGLCCPTVMLKHNHEEHLCVCVCECVGSERIDRKPTP